MKYQVDVMIEISNIWVPFAKKIRGLNYFDLQIKFKRRTFEPKDIQKAQFYHHYHQLGWRSNYIKLSRPVQVTILYSD